MYPLIVRHFFLFTPPFINDWDFLEYQSIDFYDSLYDNIPSILILKTSETFMQGGSANCYNLYTLVDLRHPITLTKVLTQYRENIVI